MAIVKHIKSRNTNYSVDIDNMYEFASSHCTDFKDLRDDEDIVINREWILNKLTEEEKWIQNAKRSSTACWNTINQRMLRISRTC